MLWGWTGQRRAARIRSSQSETTRWSEEERQKIVQASLKPGTTVDTVARLYGVNASQIYDWRKQPRQRIKADKRSTLLPVQVAKGVPVAVPKL